MRPTIQPSWPWCSRRSSQEAVLVWLHYHGARWLPEHTMEIEANAIMPDRVIVGRSAKVKPRRLSAGENFAGTVVRYYFQVPESTFPDQLRLAVADIPPLRLPPISRVY